MKLKCLFGMHDLEIKHGSNEFTRLYEDLSSDTLTILTTVWTKAECKHCGKLFHYTSYLEKSYAQPK